MTNESLEGASQVDGFGDRFYLVCMRQKKMLLCGVVFVFMFLSISDVLVVAFFVGCPTLEFPGRRTL